MGRGKSVFFIIIDKQIVLKVIGVRTKSANITYLFKIKLQSEEVAELRSNSSFPPSRDLHTVKKNHSLREKSNRKPGGQPNHRGSTLQQSDFPTS
ncbi:hypothetical protein K4L44_09095 [Halosquirtibacter laminarini]|uniref:Uncharacterized protein n=1 Tax=Halosquirtibacter laminarini TaxID=3374600 RepID=A0AC61NBB8_9BACT|nr:hypothetical protein K4L44_09095 [Prolixibacteraceae bacterium]